MSASRRSSSWLLVGAALLAGCRSSALQPALQPDAAALALDGGPGDLSSFTGPDTPDGDLGAPPDLHGPEVAAADMDLDGAGPDSTGDAADGPAVCPSDATACDGLGGALLLVPETYDLGTAMIGAIGEGNVFSIVNDTGRPVTDLSVELVGADFLMVPSELCSSGRLDPGTGCTVLVALRPASRGPKSGALIARGLGMTVTATLSGLGLAGPELAMEPTNATFDTLAGTPSSPVVFTLINGGDVASGDLTIALGGADAASFAITENGCVVPLPRSRICHFSVRASSASAGLKMASVTVSSPSGGQVTASLTAYVH
jgi:hypothetical protein